MSALLGGIDARIVQIVQNGRGITGAAGSTTTLVRRLSLVPPLVGQPYGVTANGTAVTYTIGFMEGIVEILDHLAAQLLAITGLFTSVTKDYTGDGSLTCTSLAPVTFTSPVRLAVADTAAVFSTHAQAIAIPVGSFRRSEGKAPLDDPGLDGAAFDRAYDIVWGTTDEGDGVNEFDAVSLVTVKAAVEVGVLVGQGVASLIKVQGTETTADLSSPNERALGISLQIRRAMTCGELYQGNDVDPPIIMCARDGATTTRMVEGGGRMIVSTPFVMTLAIDNTNPYRP